jgi:cell division protein FtsN
MPRAERAPVAFGSIARHDEEGSSNRKWLLFGVLGVVALIAIWFLMSSQGPAPSSTVEPAASEPAGTRAAPTTVPPPPANVAPPTEPATPPAATPPTSTSPAPPNGTPTAGAASDGERFEIIVASFRTDARASQVASEVTALGLPIRRRVSDGWQQVLAGPFGSRGEASAAQQRLDDAGLTGTQIVPLP